uniref:Putative secreted protein n=1 Tax=Anopheles marajoara TaxID=58244 RepID=A0A2M4CF59_9DIPT
MRKALLLFVHVSCDTTISTGDDYCPIVTFTTAPLHNYPHYYTVNPHPQVTRSETKRGGLMSTRPLLI